jgi:hypothetical protein
MEVLTEWIDVPEDIVDLIIKLFAKRLKSDYDTIERIFNLANPKVVIHEKLHYWRIEPEHGVLLKKLIIQYT